jgi:hypothetical protein
MKQQFFIDWMPILMELKSANAFYIFPFSVNGPRTVAQFRLLSALSRSKLASANLSDGECQRQSPDLYFGTKKPISSKSRSALIGLHGQRASSRNVMADL